MAAEQARLPPPAIRGWRVRSMHTVSAVAVNLEQECSKLTRKESPTAICLAAVGMLALSARAGHSAHDVPAPAGLHPQTIGESEPAQSSFVTIAPFSVTSNGKGELSSNDYRISIDSSGILKIKYIAPQSHCSDIRIHIGVDGAEKSVSDPVRPGDTTGYVDVGPVAPGGHIVSLRGEGVLGGCNTGTVTSWGGSAIIETSGQAEDRTADELGPLVFNYAFTSPAWGDSARKGCYIAANGGLYSYAYPRGAAAPQPAADRQGSYLKSDLLEQFSANRKLIGHLSQAELAEMRGFGTVAQHAASGTLDERQQSSGAGSATLRVFLQYRRVYVMKPSQPEAVLYHPILLEEHGDRERQNTSAAAKTLRTWYAAAARDTGCTP